MTQPLVLAIDQGTTSSRALVFNPALDVVALAQQEFPSSFPTEGWVEQDPEAIWSTTLGVARQAITTAERGGGEVVSIGITNQRETVLVWDRLTGNAIHDAIVWQDRRTANQCAELHQAGREPLIRARTGLLLDPYFSAGKLRWILENVEGARALADRGRLAFGTVDSFLLWRLTGGRVHATDATNASRTSLFDYRRQCWDPELLALFDVPESVLPEVHDCAHDYGTTRPELLGREIPVQGIAGDQQAAAIGQCCFHRGTIKATYGTGCFVVTNTGSEIVDSDNRLLGTVAYRLDGETTYALEGSIFAAGSTVQWLRDGLRFIDAAEQTEAVARSLSGNGGVYLVPAFTGLGAPHWDPDVRGAVLGLTFGTRPAHLVRAALESVCYQTADLLAAVAEDGVDVQALRVDGGMVGNGWMLQFLADVLDVAVDRPVVMETTALGAAYLAGRTAGLFGDLDDFAARWKLERRFAPAMAAPERDRLLGQWRRALASVRNAAGA